MKERLEKLQVFIAEMDLAGCVVAKPENIYYFTGVYPIESSFLIVPGNREPTLLVAPSSYREAEESSRVAVVKGELNILASLKRSLLELSFLQVKNDVYVRNLLGGWRSKPLGIEGDYIGVNVLEALGDPKYIDITPEVMRLRMVKDDKEIKNIEKAVEISEGALKEAAQHLALGMSERAVSGIFDQAAKRLGGNETKARVRAGVNTAKPFARMMDGEIVKGPVLIDFGCTYNGYWCDITRMFHIGEPKEEFLRAYEAVLKARERGLEAARAGEEIPKMDEGVREVLQEHGYEDSLVYTTGHGIGLEVHEPPLISSTTPMPETPKLYSDGDVQRMYRVMSAVLGEGEKPRFQENTVIALEPGVYLKDFGVRVEDMVLIKKKGKLLSSFPVGLEEIVI